VIRNERYVPGSRVREHVADVFVPDLPGPLPIVLYVHGGAFIHLSKDSHYILARSYARRGYLVFNISYRLAPKHPFPAAVEDVAAAYRWVVRWAAEEFGGDLSRLVLAGESAGANLVTALTMATVYERPEPFAQRVYETGVVPSAVVPACGVFQVSDTMRMVRRKRGRLDAFVRWTLRRMERCYLGLSRVESATVLDFADPLLWLERGEAPDRPLPPFFLPVGTRDPLLDDTRRLHAALEALGGTSEARYYPGEIHAFHAMLFREAARRCWRDTFGFLEAHLNAPEPGSPNRPRVHSGRRPRASAAARPRAHAPSRPRGPAASALVGDPGGLPRGAPPAADDPHSGDAGHH
jgi:acetyl esterase